MATKKTEENPLSNIPAEVLKEVMAEQKQFADGVLEYDLPDALEDVAHPLTMGEKKQYKKYDLQNVDGVEEIDDLIVELLSKRGLATGDIDGFAYSDLLMWVRKVCYGTFHLKKLVAKK